MKVTYELLRRMVREQVEADTTYEKIKAKRERQARSKAGRDNIIGKDLVRLSHCVAEAIVPILLNCFGDDVLREGTDIKVLIKKLRKDIYERVLATISDLEQARKGKYRDLS